MNFSSTTYIPSWWKHKMNDSKRARISNMNIGNKIVKTISLCGTSCLWTPFHSSEMISHPLLDLCWKFLTDCCKAELFSCDIKRKVHQSRAKPFSRKYLSTVVRLKSLGHNGTFQSGRTSSCNSINSLEKDALRITTLKMYFFQIENSWRCF